MLPKISYLVTSTRVEARKNRHSINPNDFSQRGLSSSSALKSLKCRALCRGSSCEQRQAMLNWRQKLLKVTSTALHSESSAHVVERLSLGLTGRQCCLTDAGMLGGYPKSSLQLREERGFRSLDQKAIRMSRRHLPFFPSLIK